jgi:hypothetical protein
MFQCVNAKHVTKFSLNFKHLVAIQQVTRSLGHWKLLKMMATTTAPTKNTSFMGAPFVDLHTQLDKPLVDI